MWTSVGLLSAGLLAKQNKLPRIKFLVDRHINCLYIKYIIQT